MIGRLGDGPERPLGDGRAADRVREGQNAFLDLGRQAEQAHDLGYPGSGQAVFPGDLGLCSDLTRFELPTPLLGLAEELDHVGRPGLLRGLGRSPGVRGHVHDPVSGDAPLEGTHPLVLERAFGPERDIHGLFV